MVHVARIRSRTFFEVEHPDMPSAIITVSHSDDLPEPSSQAFENSNNEVSNQFCN